MTVPKKKKSIRPEPVKCRICGNEPGIHSVFEREGINWVQVAIGSKCKREYDRKHPSKVAVRYVMEEKT